MIYKLDVFSLSDDHTGSTETDYTSIEIKFLKKLLAVNDHATKCGTGTARS